jgi:hypothetical protein
MPRLASARSKLEAKDLPAAVTIYEEVLAVAGDRADVLVTISGDLGSNGHVGQIIELIAPRYDADRHGPATGLNILQAYLAVRNAGAAQHVLDLLFALNRAELEERLYGFSNAIADLMAHAPAAPTTVEGLGSEAPAAGMAKVALVSISKPIWFYGLEPLTAEILPTKEGRLRRIAFAQLALPEAYKDLGAAMKGPEDELGRISRGLPLWFAETFYFSANYTPIAAIGLLDDPEAGKFHAIFPSEWTSENLQQLVDSASEGVDYIFTGALRQTAGDYELLLRVFEVKKFRERKTFSARWTPLTADEALTRLHTQICTFMEWSPAKSGLPYSAPEQSRTWLDVLAASLSLFLGEKQLLTRSQWPLLQPLFDGAGPLARSSPAASLAWLTAQTRAARLGITPGLAELPLSDHPLVEQARQALHG